MTLFASYRKEKNYYSLSKAIAKRKDLCNRTKQKLLYVGLVMSQ